MYPSIRWAFKSGTQINRKLAKKKTKKKAKIFIANTNNIFFIFKICECPITLDDNLQFESLSHNEHLESQKFRVLEDELNDLFEITRDLKRQNYECHRKRLSDIFQKSVNMEMVILSDY